MQYLTLMNSVTRDAQLQELSFEVHCEPECTSVSEV